MKRKFTFLYLLNIFLFTDNFSQSYVPLPLQNCTWYYSVGSGTSNSSLMQTCLYNDNYKLYPNGDTIISGKKYIKMFNEWINGSGGAISGPPCTPYSPPSSTLTLVYGLRQDTLAKKIYILTFSSTNPETLMYDFNLLKNDTVKTSLSDFGSIPPCGTTRYRIIDSIYYQSYSDGICRKTYKLKSYANCVGMTAVDYYIEGYGTEANLSTKIKYINQNFGGFGTGSMQSVSLSTLVINANTIAAVTNTCLQNVSLKEKNNDLFLSVFPNPTNDRLLIEGLKSLDAQIELLSMLGHKQDILISEAAPTRILNLEKCHPGIYILRISSGDKSYSKKIIKTE